MAKRSPLDRYPVTQKYLMTRGQALTFPSQLLNMPIKSEEVFGIVIDMPMGPQVLTSMVCFVNGAANLYFNNGGEYAGASQRYRNLVIAARNLVVNANALKPQCDKVKAFDMPVGRTHFIYLLTKKGVFKTSLDPLDVSKESNEKRVVFALYQQVLSEIRQCQLKDQAAAANK
ncbi:MAG: hypothetical protein LKG21_07395 [Ruminococcus sp.]|nr:hypothetical protein [Ruminococcus sp.]